MGLFFMVFIFYFCTWFGCVRPMWQVAEVELMRNISTALVPSSPSGARTITPPSPTKQEHGEKKNLISTSTEKCNVRDAHETKFTQRKPIAPNPARRQVPRRHLYASLPTLKGRWCILLLAFAADTMTSTFDTKHFH